PSCLEVPGLHLRGVDGRLRGSGLTSYQRARRIAAWRGSFSMLFACTFFMLASALAGGITS
ncbi:hypothetical protein OO256_28820, partial [Pseudomonas sp. DCB_CB]|uniref:hypothetical protein n=1 Tax=unclassified Pseudomonas TaxID=196821 RepID=UPI002248D701